MYPPFRIIFSKTLIDPGFTLLQPSSSGSSLPGPGVFIMSGHNILPWNSTVLSFVRSQTGKFDDLLGSWVDILKKTEPNVMTLKIQKDVDSYKVIEEA